MNNKIILLTLSPKSHRTSEENLGIEYLKAVLNQINFDVVLIDAWLNEISIDNVYEQIINEDNILFIGISSYMMNTEPSIELIKKLKRKDKNYKIMCGGFGPTFNPLIYLECGSDFIIRGEGEKAICELATKLKNNSSPYDIDNLGYLKNGKLVLNNMKCLINDLDSIPFPSRDYLDVIKEKKSTVNMVTSRGCSGNCEFCSVISFFRLADGKVWRTRSINNIVDEIEDLYNKGVTHIKIVDDSFIDGIRDEKWCQDFADEIEKRNIKVYLRGQIRADKVNDSILYNLKRAGFFSFACGIENGSQTALSRMNKAATLDINKKALELFKKYDYIVQMGFILFDNETSIEELIENYEFLKEYSYTITKGIFSEMYSAEGTKFNNRLRLENKLKEKANNNSYEIENEKVYEIYKAIKKWHKSHSEIYDMTIDPVGAPKAINIEEMQLFYEYIMELKKLDLEFFGKILDYIKREINMDIDFYVDTLIDETKCNYNNIYNNVKKLYKENNLSYKATLNPFI